MPEAQSPRALILGSPHAASHLHPGLSYSSGTGDHDGSGSTTGALGAHRRVIGRHPFEGVPPVGSLYQHETRPVYKLAPAPGTQQVDTDSFASRWFCHASPFALLYVAEFMACAAPIYELPIETACRYPGGHRRDVPVKGKCEPDGNLEWGEDWVGRY